MPDHLKQIADELIQLYRRQLTLWVLGKIDNLNEADSRKYDRRQRRIEQLRRELELIAEYGEPRGIELRAACKGP